MSCCVYIGVAMASVVILSVSHSVVIISDRIQDFCALQPELLQINSKILL